MDLITASLIARDANAVYNETAEVTRRLLNKQGNNPADDYLKYWVAKQQQTRNTAIDAKAQVKRIEQEMENDLIAEAQETDINSMFV